METALDGIYNKLDDLLLSEKFSEADSILRQVDIAETEATILICYLTATLPAHQNLPYRTEFFSRIQAELNERGESPNILKGLDK